MKKLIIIILLAWIIAPYIHMFQVGSSVGVGIGSAIGFTKFTAGAVQFLLWGFVVLIGIGIISMLIPKRKKSSSIKKNETTQFKA